MDTSVPALSALPAVLSPLLGQQQQPSGALLSPTQPLLTQQQPTASAGAPVAAAQQLQSGAVVPAIRVRHCLGHEQLVTGENLLI